MNRISYPSRRQASDVFNGDPFKIHSYNFRYADKPFYPVQNYQRSQPPTRPALVKKASFQTFYHNPRFSQDPEYIPAKRSPLTATYRRRLLQESMDMPLGTPLGTPDRQSVPVAPQTRRLPTATDSPLLRTCCQSGRYQAMRRGPSITTLCQSSNNLLRSAGGVALPTSTTTFSRNSNTLLQNRRSGCGISINICSADSQSEMDNNVSIKIATDAYLLNNTDKVRTKSQSERCTPRSSGTFGIDKRLSKFNVSETKPRTSPEWELRQREKAREVERQRERERDRQLLEDRRLEQERELQEERERARQRERDREQFRQLERLRDEERLIELEVERERQRLRELERESQRHREYEQLCALQEQSRREQLELLRQEPINPRPPVPMTSHLYTTTSDDRLPGMAFCDLTSRRTRRLETATENPSRPKDRRKTRVNQDARSVSSATRSLTPPPILIQNSSSPSPTAPCTPTSRSSSVNRMANRCSSRSSTPIPNPQGSATPTVPRNLDRSSSGTSNGNVHVTVTTTGRRSNCSMRRSSHARVSEQKQLNGNQTCVTCLNNMPIRITTSRSRDTDLAFSLNHVRMRGSSPAPRERSSSQESQDSCQVNISVYADKLRLMRL